MAGTPNAPKPPRVTVTLTHALVRLFPEAQTTLDLEAATVSDLLDALDSRWPGMRDRLSDSSPAIRRHINVFVDGQKATLSTELRQGSEVYVLTAMSGG
jgi:sulfur-carrier protein